MKTVRIEKQTKDKIVKIAKQQGLRHWKVVEIAIDKLLQENGNEKSDKAS